VIREENHALTSVTNA